MNHDELTNLHEVCRTTAVEAGQLLHEKWAQPRTITTKGFRDVVTDADLAAQAHITQRILAAFPGHGFVPEEQDSTLPTSGPVLWLIDPLDGTSNYSRQLGSYCVSIAALQEGRILTSAIYDPQRGELFTAVVGRGAWLNGHPLTVAPTDQLGEAFLGVDWAHGRDERQRILDLVQQLGPQLRTIRAFGSAALALAWVAAGRLDAYLNVSLQPWDMAAGQLLIQEAGGQLTDENARPWHIHTRFCLASNGHLHPILLKRVQGAWDKGQGSG